MAYIEILETKYSEIKHLRSRGLLHLFYEAAWDDVMKIVRGKHPSLVSKKPIAITAEEFGCVIRIACSPDRGWVGTIRPKRNGSDATVYRAKNYYDLENTLRQSLEKYGVKATNEKGGER